MSLFLLPCTCNNREWHGRGGLPLPFYAKLHVSISECIKVFLSKRYMPPPHYSVTLWLWNFMKVPWYIYSAMAKLGFCFFPLWKTIAMDWLKRNLLFSKFITGTYVKGDLFSFCRITCFTLIISTSNTECASVNYRKLVNLNIYNFNLKCTCIFIKLILNLPQSRYTISNFPFFKDALTFITSGCLC